MTEPIIAYRTWNIVSGNLCAVAQDNTLWPARKRFVATCRQPNSLYDAYGRLTRPAHLEGAPLSTCACGVYAFKDIGLVADHLRPTDMYGATITAKRVAGRVSLWGDVIECERGYRAQYAYPAVLYYTQENRDLVRGVADRYAVDAMPLPENIVTELAKPVDDLATSMRRILACAAANAPRSR